MNNELKVCNECKGDGTIEHIGESIYEDCEHCNGTGRLDKKTKNDVFREYLNCLLFKLLNP